MARLRRPTWVNYQFHPFKIYNVPAEYCINPNDSWRTFAVRDGLLGMRSQKSAAGDQPIVTSGGSAVMGNREILKKPSGTDGIVAGFGLMESDYQIELYGSGQIPSVVQLDGYNETTRYIGPVQFILTDVANASTGWGGAAFYLKIDDSDPSGALVSLIARMWDTTTGQFPAADPNIIPLGFVWVPINSGTGVGHYVPGTPTQMAVWQMVYDNLTNRFPTYPGIVGSALNPRGDWTSDSLSGQYFWPGDVVTVDATSSAGGVTLTGKAAYYYATSGIESSPPPGANWRVLNSWTLT